MKRPPPKPVIPKIDWDELKRIHRSFPCQRCGKLVEVGKACACKGKK